ncbi:MAG: hypothetical protein KKH72_15100 [Alphaproteobacteria bacterium]|nr:hypothetical protein [Alphaproteobacteria bacterium]
MDARKGHYPYQARLDAYGNLGFRFAEMSHRGSLLCLPTGMHAWAVTGPDELTLDAFAPVLAVADRLEILLIGMGETFRPLPAALKQAFRDHGIVAEPGSTGSMARTYNVLFAEERAVGAALIAVADAGGR